MPSKWAMVDNSFPTFRGDEKPGEQIGMLTDYMYLLVEELKYQLANLDGSNWNETALKTLQEDTTADVSQQVAALAVNVKSMTGQITSLVSRLSALEGLGDRVTAAETCVSYLEKRQEEATEELEGLSGQMAELVSGQETLTAELEALTNVIVLDGDGGAAIGKEGQELRLYGNIYINGQLME